MFGLIRRLSHSVIPRPDRPWEDDPTSNAPHKPRKRRLSTSENEEANSGRPLSTPRAGYAGESATKRARGEGAASSGVVDEFGGWSAPPQEHWSQSQNQNQNQNQNQHQQEENPTPLSSAIEPQQEQQQQQQTETPGVKEVTQGVKEVELEDKKEETRAGEVEESVKAVHPESVPLPDEDEVDELDEDSGSNANKEAETATIVEASKPVQDKEQTKEAEES
ncbi:hypothetical protein AX15_000353 [Amanita polypyramis BW_CC]|nr:hypothetical protein AX15_000353 [Amanita polypyramis BW_CC]